MEVRIEQCDSDGVTLTVYDTDYLCEVYLRPDRQKFDGKKHYNLSVYSGDKGTSDRIFVSTVLGRLSD